MSTSSNQMITRSDDTRMSLPVAASTKIPEGTLGFVSSAGRADDDTNSGANAFAGISIFCADNSDGLAGDINAEFFTEGCFLLSGSGFSQATVGQRIYATDNYTITSDPAASGAVYIGTCRAFVSSAQIFVCIEVESLKLPFIQAAAYTQTYNTAARVVPAATQVDVVTTSATNSTPYGYSQAQANAIVTAVNAAGADILALKKVITALIDDLQAAGLVG